MFKLEPWQRALYAVAIAQFIALGGGNLVFPFIPFYVEDLGITGESSIALWSGLLTTATGSMLFIFSPIWGNLADRFGRKPLLLRIGDLGFNRAVDRDLGLGARTKGDQDRRQDQKS